MTTLSSLLGETASLGVNYPLHLHLFQVAKLHRLVSWIKNLWHIGASTHPGPGLGGVSGLHVAQHLAKQ